MSNPEQDTATEMMDEKRVKQSTQDKYDSIYGTYKARFLLESNSTDGTRFPWKDFALWLVAAVEEKGFSTSYKNAIRSAVLHKIKDQSDGEDAQIAIRMIEAWDISSNPRMSAHTSAKKMGEEPDKKRSRENRRMIPKEDWSLLINHFNMKPSKWGSRAQSMISASIACGARPIEWIGAHLIDDQTVRIYNAKIKNVNAWNRVAPGLFYEGQFNIMQTRQEMDRSIERRIQSSGLDPVKDIALIMEIRKNPADFEQKVFRDVTFEPNFLLPIRMTLRYVDTFFQEKYGANWRETIPGEELERVYKTEFYAKVRIAVWRACKSLFGEDKLYSPADARSTFAANRKAQYGLERTASDMGHSSTSKTQNNYAPARKAWS